jgi:hypothetical protein
MGPKDRHIKVTAIAFSDLIQKNDLKWEPPMRSLMAAPEAADYVWRRLQFVFDLDDPRLFPNLRSDAPTPDAPVKRLRRLSLSQT